MRRRFASSQALSLERRFSWARRGGGNRGTGRGGGWEGSNPHMVPSKKEKPGVATVSPLFSQAHQANWKKLNMIQGYQQVNMLQLLLDVTIHWSAPNIHHCLVWSQKLFNKCPQENYLRPDSFVSTPHLGWAARVNNFPSCGSGEPGSQAAALLSGLGQAWQFHWSWPSWSSPPPQAALGEACGSGRSVGSHSHPRGCQRWPPQGGTSCGPPSSWSCPPPHHHLPCALVLLGKPKITDSAKLNTNKKMKEFAEESIK